VGLELIAEMWIEKAVGRAEEATILLDQMPHSQGNVGFHVGPSTHDRESRATRNVALLNAPNGAFLFL
jgi:hypothetical protein